MAWDFTPYAVALLLSAGLMLVLLRTAWPYRRVPGGWPLMGLLASLCAYGLGIGLEAAAVGVPAKVFWAVAEYPGLVASPVFYLAFCLDYTQQTQWLPPRQRRWLWLFPAATVAAAATNGWHHWLWTSFTPAANNALLYGHGPWYWLLVIYSYSLILAGLAGLVRAIARWPGLYRQQAGALLISFLAPFLGNILYVLGLSPFPGFDVGPFMFSITALGLTWSLVRHDLLNLVPVAQDLVVESMQDGVLVLDTQDRVVVANAALRRWLGLRSGAIGQPVAVVLAKWPALREGLDGLGPPPTELRLDGPPARHLDLRVTPLSNRGGLSGRIVALHDITELKLAEEQLQQANTLLQAQLATIEGLQASLREQAVRDPLTGLFNRRYLDETLARELARAQRARAPLSLVMLDIDGFKQLNDRHGHAAGDRVLKSLASLLAEATRASDIVCRYGGEEFLVVMPGAGAELARERAEAWRLSFEVLSWLEAGQTLRSTFSAGVAAWPDHADEDGALRRRADQALYRAKAAGRNRVVMAEPAEVAPAAP